MQHLGFEAKSPEEQPQAQVFFVAPENFDLLPMNCATLYLTTPLSPARHRMLAKQLPADSLLVDYATTTDWAAYGLTVKAELDLLVQQEWQNVLQFMTNEKIDLFSLSTNPYDSAALDDTLDTLLAASHHFLQVTSTFFRAYECAQPFQSDPAIRKGYEILGLLARKVDALTPGYFSQHLRRTYDEPEKFILFDNNGKAYRQYCQAKEIFRHRKAGRLRLAQALIGIA
jgi:hypothetical protein